MPKIFLYLQLFFEKCLVQEAFMFIKSFLVHKAPSEPFCKVERTGIICWMRKSEQKVQVLFSSSNGQR